MYRVHPQPTFVPYTLPPPTQIQISLDHVDTSHYSFAVKWMFFYMTYKKYIKFTLFVLFIAIILMTILLTVRHKISNNPCISYSSDTLANKVSITCFHHLWSRSCTVSLPDSYNGRWWLRSPNGGRLVRCIPPHTGELCGAGSYSSITLYIFRCRIDEDGI